MTVLYHYCSTNNFVSILSSKCIWLSSLSMSNDSMEGKLVAETIERLAKQQNFDGTSIEHLQKAVKFIEEICDGLGFCLSEEGDLLSQWRGYAADATGFSIGFSKKYLLSLTERLKGDNQPGFSLQKVEYDPAEQEKQVIPIYEEVKRMNDSGSLKNPHRIGLLDPRSLSGLMF